MNAHEDFEDLVEPYVAGGLAPEERAAFDTHLVDCQECTAAVADAQEFAAFMTETLEELRPPEDLEDRLVVGMGWRWGVTRKPLPTWAKFAAAAVVLFLVGAVANAPSIVGALPADSAPALRGYAAAGEDLQPEADMFYAGVGRHELEEADKSGAVADSPLYVGGATAPPAAWPEIPVEELGQRAARDLQDPFRTSGEALREGRRAQVTSGSDPVFQDFAVSDGRGGRGRRGADPQEPQQTQDRKIIKNGTLEFEVDSFDAAFNRITALVTEAGGFVSTSSRRKLPNGKIMGTVVVRVPQAEFSTLVLAFAELGDLKNQQISSQEVTKQYVDLTSRLRSKTVLEERLIKMLEEAEGELKDLLQVEKELGTVRGEIERIQGELNYYDNLVSLSTVTLNLRERDIGQPFEYVQTLQSEIGVAVEDVETAYQRAQDIIADNQGRILDAGMTRQGEEQATGRIIAAVDAEVFPAVRVALRGLGTVSVDTVTRTQQPRGGTGDVPSADAPVIREQARIALQVAMPVRVVTMEGNLSVIADDPAAAFESARQAAEAVGGEVTGGGMTDHANGSRGSLQIRVDAARAAQLIDELEGLGEVQQSTVTRQEPAGDPGLRREQGQIALAITSPPRLVDQDEGFGAVFRDTIAGSLRGILWSLEMLVVGIAYVGPWLLGLVLVLVLYRRSKRKKAAEVGEAS